MTIIGLAQGPVPCPSGHEFYNYSIETLIDITILHFIFQYVREQKKLQDLIHVQKKARLNLGAMNFTIKVQGFMDIMVMHVAFFLQERRFLTMWPFNMLGLCYEAPSCSQPIFKTKKGNNRPSSFQEVCEIIIGRRVRSTKTNCNMSLVLSKLLSLS